MHTKTKKLGNKKKAWLQCGRKTNNRTYTWSKYKQREMKGFNLDMLYGNLWTKRILPIGIFCCVCRDRCDVICYVAASSSLPDMLLARVRNVPVSCKANESVWGVARQWHKSQIIQRYQLRYGVMLWSAPSTLIRYDSIQQYYLKSGQEALRLNSRTIILALTLCESLAFFFVSPYCVNLIRLFLCDDTLQ